MSRKPQLSIKYLKKLFHNYAENGSTLTKDQAAAAIAELPEENRRFKHFSKDFDEHANEGHLTFTGFLHFVDPNGQTHARKLKRDTSVSERSISDDWTECTTARLTEENSANDCKQLELVQKQHKTTEKKSAKGSRGSSSSESDTENEGEGAHDEGIPKLTSSSESKPTHDENQQGTHVHKHHEKKHHKHHVKAHENDTSSSSSSSSDSEP
ncbi:unnamed protein product, partial [Cylicostephanus goldi]